MTSSRDPDRRDLVRRVTRLPKIATRAGGVALQSAARCGKPVVMLHGRRTHRATSADRDRIAGAVRAAETLGFEFHNPGERKRALIGMIAVSARVRCPSALGPPAVSMAESIRAG